MKDDKNKLDYDRDLHISALSLCIETAEKMTVAMFLDGFLRVMPELSTSDAFRSTIFLAIRSVEYALKTKDVKGLNLMNIFVAKIRKEEEPLSKSLVSLIEKMIDLSEKGFPVSDFMHSYEFGCVVIEFNKIADSSKKPSLFDEFASSLAGEGDKKHFHSNN